MPPRRLAWACLGTAALLTALLLALPSTFLSGYDYVNLHVFYKQYLRDGLLSGQAPWWNPYVALGRPFFADLETACCYPPNWLVVPLGVTAGVTAIIGLHLALALYGGVRLGRELGLADRWAWLGALTFSLSGFLVGRLQLGQIQVVCCLCWLPLVFYAAARLQLRPDRASGARMAVILALWILAGGPPFLWVGGLGLVVWMAARSPSLQVAARGLLALAAAAGVAAALAAVQLGPWLELLGEGNRPLRSVAYSTLHGLTFGDWLALGAPPSDTMLIGPEENVGIGLPLAIAAIAGLFLAWRRRQDRALAILALLAAALAAGAHTPLLPFLAAHVPGFGALRFPARYGALAAFALLWLGTLTLARLVPARLAAAAAVLQLVAVALVAFESARHYALPARPYWDADVRSDLAAHGAFGPSGVPPRISFDQRNVRPDSGMAQGYSTLGGFANPQLGRVWAAVHAAAGVTAPAFNVHEFDPHVFDHGAFPVPDANLVLGWDVKAGASIWRGPAQADPRAMVRGGGTAAITRFARNSLEAEVESPAGGTLVLAEPWYPGWTATVNGTPVPVVAEGWKRGVAVPAGASRVQLVFRPQHFLLCAAVSAAALAAVAVGWRRKPAGVVRPTA